MLSRLSFLVAVAALAAGFMLDAPANAAMAVRHPTPKASVRPPSSSPLPSLSPPSSPSPSPSAAPIPVEIENRQLSFAESPWTIAVALATGVLAIATFAMAVYTKRLADQTRASLITANAALDAEMQARKDEERRHQDMFMPHLTLVPTDVGAEHMTVGGGVTKQVMGREIYIQNIGLGPALNVSVTYVPLVARSLYYTKLPIAFSAGQREMAVRGPAEDVDIEICVEYEDVFRRAYCSKLSGKFNPNTPYEWDRL